MAQYKEFQGKTLDEAIKDACEYYGVSRSKLEIDIVSDAKSGIFGLVGAKKATIRACRANLDDFTTKDTPDEAAENKRPRGQQKQGRGASSQKTPGRNMHDAPAQADSPVALAESSDGNHAPRNDTAPEDFEGTEAAPDETAPSARNRQQAGQQARQQARQPGGGRRGGKKGPGENGAAASSQTGKRETSRQERQPKDERSEGPSAKDGGKRGRRDNAAPKQALERTEPAADFALEDDAAALRDDLPDMDLANCDKEQLFAVVEDVVLKLVSPIVGTVPCSVSLAGKRVRAELDCGEAAGILVGREGQTLASLQYLASRIISRKLGASVHVQLDTGRYRERQEDRLRELALALAEKVKKTGRQQATRPLSAYQRRVVHLALEPDSAVQTKSSGDGPQRRVVIFLNKAARQENAAAAAAAPDDSSAA